MYITPHLLPRSPINFKNYIFVCIHLLLIISVQQVQVCIKHHLLDFKQAKPAVIITDGYAVFLNVKMAIIHLHVQLSIPHLQVKVSEATVVMSYPK